jgi:UDP-3-O-[3-hydroxymyristoyl] glucosamine N-acyltransferase
MQATLGELAALVDGEVYGDPSLKLAGAGPFQSAGPDQITLAASRAYLSRLAQTQAGAIIVPAAADLAGRPQIRCSQPKVAFALILQHFHRTPFTSLGISPQARIGSDCRIPERVSIHPGVSVGSGVELGEEVTLHPGVSVGDGCTIGAGTTLHPNVSLYPGVKIGLRGIVHSGTVIGSDGFGYVFDGTRQVKIPQTGGVEIGDDVEIGANCCIDRATFGITRIEDHVKLDNLVHIAHNCRIGANTVIVGCVGISGSVEIGRNCVLAGQSGAADHVRIGDGVTVLARGAVYSDIPAGSVVSGAPARNHREELKVQAALRHLPELLTELRRLKRKTAE